VKLSSKGADFIARFEGYRGEPYDDPAGHATIGFGHLIHRGPVTKVDRVAWGTISRAKALDMLRKDAAVFEQCITRHVKVKVTQAQFDALVSFAFNLGCGALIQSTLLRHLNADRRRQAADEFLKWNKAGSPLRPFAGLTRRRQEERKLFLTGLYKPGSAPAQKPAIRLPYAKGPSKSFTWLEVHKGRGAPATVRARAILHARKMEQLRAEVNKMRAKHSLRATGINVLSWYRPRWYNVQIGGATNSRHIQGDACDIALEEIKRLCPWDGGRADFDRLCDRLFASGGFGQYPMGSRHVDSRGNRARWTSF
jgi:lysozyme